MKAGLKVKHAAFAILPALSLTACGGGGGSTMARLAAFSSSTCQVEADTNGDGIYDWNSGVMNWSDL